MKEAEILESLPSALQSCLENVPETRIESITRGIPYAENMIATLVVELLVLGRETTVLFEAKATGQPKRAREAVEQLRRLAGTLDQRVYPVFAAPYISEASALICRESGVGYLDLAGNCRLSFEDTYVERVSSQNPYRDKREGASLFSPKSSRLLRVLLNDPKRTWQVQQLSRAADVSIGLASRVKQALEEREWVASTPDGIKLVQPETLLMAWSDVYSYKQNQVAEYYTLDPIPEAEMAIATWCRESAVPYALTGFSGARLSSPRVQYNRASLYVSAGTGSVAAGTGLKRVESGGNVLLLTPYDDGVFAVARSMYDMQTVSPVQLFLDVKSMPGRGEEAAEEILIRELRPSWQ